MPPAPGKLTNMFHFCICFTWNTFQSLCLTDAIFLAKGWVEAGFKYEIAYNSSLALPTSSPTLLAFHFRPALLTNRIRPIPSRCQPPVRSVENSTSWFHPRGRKTIGERHFTIEPHFQLCFIFADSSLYLMCMQLKLSRCFLVFVFLPGSVYAYPRAINHAALITYTIYNGISYRWNWV